MGPEKKPKGIPVENSMGGIGAVSELPALEEVSVARKWRYQLLMK